MFYYKNHVLRCSALDTPALRHGFATRNGGVSTGHFSSMNLGYNRGDIRENVKENYRLLGEYVGASMESLAYLQQVHSGLIHEAESCQDGCMREGDALVTNVPGVPLACFYADCMPAFLYDPVKKAIAAVHSGWRGTAACILMRAVEKLQNSYGCNPQDIIAAVGPSIGACHMEVGPEVREQFLEIGFQNVREERGSLYLDLWGTAKEQLMRSGLKEEHIHIAEICTYCEEDQYFSHRRDGEKRGNLCGIIELTEQ